MRYEIPYQQDKNFGYRLFEILPGLVSWLVLLLPFVLAFTSIRLAAIFMIGYLLLWFVKAVALNIRAIQGWRVLQQHQKIDWEELIADLDQQHNETKKFPKWHYDNKNRRIESPNGINTEDIIHAVIVATWNEAREILQPTLENIRNSHYDKKKIIVLLAYEDRGGPAVEKQAIKLMKEYEDVFLIARAIKHIDAPGEVIGE